MCVGGGLHCPIFPFKYERITPIWKKQSISVLSHYRKFMVINIFKFGSHLVVFLYFFSIAYLFFLVLFLWSRIFFIKGYLFFTQLSRIAIFALTEVTTWIINTSSIILACISFTLININVARGSIKFCNRAFFKRC